MNCPILTLGELTRIRTGKLDANAANENGLYPFFTCAVESLSINTAAFDCKAVLVAGNGDLNVKYYEGKFNAYQRTYVIESLDESKLLPKYLYLFLDKHVEKLREQAIGGVIKYIKLGNLTEAKIPLPPLAEQKRIAAILNKATELKAKRKQAIDKLNELVQSKFVEMFGNLVTNEKGWKFKTLGDALREGLLEGVQDGNHGEAHPKASDFIDDGIPFIMANCLNDGKIDLNDAYKLDESWLKKLRIGFARPNDVLLSHKGTVGEVAIVPANLDVIILSPQTTYYRLSESVNSVFLAEYFKTSWFQTILKKEAIQSTRAYIGITRQKDLPFFLPPIELQEEFANFIKKIEIVKRNAFKSICQNQNLLLSLQHQAFTTGFAA